MKVRSAGGATGLSDILSNNIGGNPSLEFIMTLSMGCNSKDNLLNFL